MSESNSPTLEARRAQMFPVLAADEIARLHRFGTPRRFPDGAHVVETGKVSPGIYLAKPIFPLAGEWNVYVEAHRANEMSARTIQFNVPE